MRSDCHYPYEAITKAAGGDRDKVVARGEAVLCNGWICHEYPAVILSGEIPWALASQEERSWNFRLHALDMLDPLLAAYDATGDRHFLQPAITVGLDWVQRHPRQATGVSPMAWYDMAVGLRSYRLAYLYDVAERSHLLDAADAVRLWRSLEEHGNELADDATIAFHSNHGLYQVAGQLALGRRFADHSRAMAELRSQGRMRLLRMLDQQFTAEGVHREHSPAYHSMVLWTLRGLMRAGLIEDSSIEVRARAIEEALSWFVTPSGSLANFGDSDDFSVLISETDAREQHLTAAMKAVTSRGLTAVLPTGLRTFPASGYAIVRTADDPNSAELPGQEAYLAQTMAFHSRTHRHADDLSFIWHDRGQPVLIDAGRYGYIGRTQAGSDLWRDGHWYSDPMRIFCESTRAHNTLEFDGRNFARVGVEPYGSGLLGAVHISGLYLIESACRHFLSIHHRRVLIFAPGRWLIVFDTFRDEQETTHAVRQWFHLSTGNVVTPVNGGMHVLLRNGRDTVQIRSLLSGVGITEVVEGQREPRIQGWWSPAERVAQPAPAFAFTVNDLAGGAFATLFTFSHDIACDIAASSCDDDGAAAQFSWHDDHGQHRVEYLRSEGPFCRYSRTS